MIPGIDAYSFHRYFGELYPGLEVAPDKAMSVWDFIDLSVELGVAAVSLESCFLPVGDRALTTALAARLDRAGLDRVWAWGHPRGLHSGAAPQALDEARASLADAVAVGATVMRICAGGRGTRPARWEDHKAALLPLLTPLVREAKALGIALAVENHIDLLADEMVDLIETIGSDHLGVCLDTANNLRLYENPKEVIRKLAPYAKATHIKDIEARGGDPGTIGFWPSVPAGRGVIDLRDAFEHLQASGYRGVLAVEIDYLSPRFGTEAEAVAESLHHIRCLLAGLQAPAA